MSEFNCKVINAKIEMFSIALANSDIDSPKIYIEDNEIACSKEEDQLICTPNERDIPQIKE